MLFCFAFDFKNQNGKFPLLNENFVSSSFTSFMASKTKTGSFYDLIRPLLLVLVYGFNFQLGKFLQLDKMLVPCSSFIAVKFIAEF